MLKNFLNIILSIFFDISIDSRWKNIFHFQNLTHHFRLEIKELYLDEIYIWAKYEQISTDLESYKYRSNRSHASTYVDILSKVVEESKIIQTNKVIGMVPIPMHWSRYFIRGFNHIDRIWLNLSKKINIPYFPVIGTSYSKRQSKLSKKQRLINRKNSFFYKKKIILPESIILIDDIISTGSTANACAKLLKENGVKKVFGVFIASNQ
jgi:competence protein ComFC